MKKTIQVTEGTAIQLATIALDGSQFISVRRMYRKKGQETWMPSRAGLTIPVEAAEQVGAYLKKMADADTSEFKELNVEE